ncbi:rod shape-determining protein MreD [Elioraea rosea]|uniref:rod shape-determining protein MreD n=1 Tax=Elioraea rosea TaxID=2492390 RepID=UPI001183AB42|nr:rod shape-determining protein MreD [Elioraea rosea]
MAVGLPRQTLLQRLDTAAHEAAPAALAVVLVIASCLPPLVPGQPGLIPSAAPAAVFFWTLYRPRLMSPLAVFGLGLLCDLLAAAPLGLNTLLLLLLHGIVLTQRRVLARQSFLLVWIAFALLATALFAVGWVLHAALAFRVLPVLPPLVELGLVIAVYPAFSWLFVRLERTLQAA